MATSPLSERAARNLFIVWWLLWALLQAYGLRSFGWPIAATDSGVTNALLAILCVLTANNLRYYGPAKNQYIYIIAWCLVLSLLWLFVSYQLLSFLFSERENYLSFWQQALPVRFGIAFLAIAWMAMLSVLWYTRQEQKEQQQRHADAEKLAREAELYKLRQQLQPHFLFNSLNSITALIGTRPTEARKMIHQLSDFLRGTLKKEEEQWVSLAEELQHMQLYLEIEKVRFGHRLSVQIECDEPCASCMLPAMLLQPVVENAIKFGLYDTTEEVSISIRAQVSEKLLLISIENPFDPKTSRPRQGTGFGLSGVQRRLYLLFARNDLLQVSTEKEIFTTTLKIPQLGIRT